MTDTRIGSGVQHTKADRRNGLGWWLRLIAVVVVAASMLSVLIYRTSVADRPLFVLPAPVEDFVRDRLPPSPNDEALPLWRSVGPVTTADGLIRVTLDV